MSSHRTESSDSREEDCAFERPTLTRRKLRGLELKAEDGRRSWPSGHALSTKQDRAREAEFAEQVETAYRRLVADWQPRAPRSGAGATRAPIFKSSSWRRDSSAAAISPRTCAFQSAKIEPTRSRFPDMARPVSSRAVVGPSWQPRSLLGLVRCHAAALVCG